MIDTQLEEPGTVRPHADGPAVSRRRLLNLIGWGLLPAAAIGLASCEAPQYDTNRGVFVMHPRK
jgi:hypothetical protein